jgi:hypothetical protein
MVNAEDFTGLLNETIDKRFQAKVEELDWKYDEKYKSIILKQKNEISELKK